MRHVILWLGRHLGKACVLTLGLLIQQTTAEAQPAAAPPFVPAQPVFPPAGQPFPSGTTPASSRTLPAPTGMVLEPDTQEVRFLDRGSLKVKILEPYLEMTTTFGKLKIPVNAIARIDCATRIAPGSAEKIEKAVKDLANEDFTKREAATKVLEAEGVRALAALKIAADSKDPETSTRAKELLTRLKQVSRADELIVKPVDVVYTRDAKYTGKIESDVLKVSTTHFGTLQLKLADIATLRSGLASSTVPANQPVNGPWSSVPSITTPPGWEVPAPAPAPAPALR